MQRNIKIGDRIYFEYPDGRIGSAIVINIRPETTKDYFGKEFSFNMLFIGPHTCIEDYNTIAPSNPKVKAYIKEMNAKRKALINEALMFAIPTEKASQRKKERLAIGCLTSLILK